MKNFKQVLGLLLLILFFSCKKAPTEFKFLFIGHSYEWGFKKDRTIDSRLFKIPVADYDGFWFGGDICSETSLNPLSLKTLDEHFNFKNPNNHIVLGNHDYRNYNHEMYYDITGRPDFYTTKIENLVISVLNTNLNSSDCENLNAQFRMLENVTDTLSYASHFILLMHHQIFPKFDGMKKFRSNGYLDNYAMNCDDASSSFVKTIYPKLVTLEEKGIEVLVVVGDSGWNKGSEEETDNGVTFLASGINNTYYRKKKVPIQKNKKDKLLEFKLDTKARTLEWNFLTLNELAEVDEEVWFSTE